MKKILLLPGWMTDLKLYNESNQFVVQKGKYISLPDAGYIIGLSLGGLVVLSEWDKTGKLILVNPPLPQRNIFLWFINWLRFIFSEGLFFRHQKFTKNPLKFALEIIKCVKLLTIDFSETLDSLDKEKLIIIKGERDNFFCDKKAVKFLRSKNIQVIEIKNAGHNWCRETEVAVNKLTKL